MSAPIRLYDGDRFARVDGLNWRGVWGYGSYEVNDVVSDGDWLMVANKNTSDRPAPQPSGDPSNVYDGTMGSYAHTDKQWVYGNRYTWQNGSYLNGWRIWTVAGNHYDVYTVKDPSGVAELSPLLDFTAAVDGWQEFTVTPVIVGAGSVLDLIVLVKEPAATPTTWTGDWDYSTPNNVSAPASGQVTHSNKATSTLSVHYTDSGGGDRTAELQALTVGDNITTEGVSWAIQSATDQGSYIDFGISPESQVSDGARTFTFETVTATPITIPVDSDYWLGSPFDVKGLTGTTYSSADLNDSAYGVDLLVQAATVSSDWDVMSVSGGSGGGVGVVIPKVTHSSGPPPTEDMKEGDLHVEYGLSDTLPEPDTDWASVTLINGWENYGSTFPPLRYRRINGVVYIQGLIGFGTLGASAGTLPVGFRPSGSLIIVPMNSTVVNSRVDIQSTGTILMHTVSSGFCSVMAVFPAEQ